MMITAASSSKLCNPGLEQENRIMARRRKKVDQDCFQPSDWLSSMELRKLPFYPQIGDEVVYCRQGHELYLNTVKHKKLYEINPISLPWSKQIIRQQELARIVDVTYEIKPPRLVCLTLGRLDPRNGALSKKRFIIRYHDMDEVPDFLVLKQDYDAAIKRQWNSSQRFRSLMNDDCGVQMWWEGQFVKREPYNPQCPESMFLCYLIRWDNGDFDRLSPWDLKNIDPRRKPLSVGANVLVLPIEIIRTSYMPGIVDWPPVGDRDCESDRISVGINQVTALDIAQPFSAPVDLNKFPTYAYVVKYPMDLGTIKARLDNRFYRRAAAVEYDVRRIHTNALLFNDPTKSNIVRNSGIITDLCLEIIRKGNADIADLSRQLLKCCKTKDISGNVQSVETSNPIQDNSERPPQESSFDGFKKKQPNAERLTEATSSDLTLNNVVAEFNQTSVPARIQDQQLTPRANQVAKKQWPTEASSISSNPHIFPKLSQFVHVDGTKTGIGLTVDDQKPADDSERKNTHFPEITKSRIKKKVIEPEAVKLVRPPKLKQTALISPYTFSGNNKSVTINLQEKDISTRDEDHTLSTARNTSRRSRLPIQGVRTENLDAIPLPAPTLSLFPTVSPSMNTAVGVFHGPQNSETGIEVRTPSINNSYFQLPTLNTPLELIGIRKEEHQSNAFISTLISPIRVPLAVSTPIRIRNKEHDSITNFGFGKPCWPKKNKENVMDGQSVFCSPSSGNPYCGKTRKKRRLSRSSLWNISLVEHMARGSSGQKSPILQEQSPQPSHRNQLPKLKILTKGCPLLLNPSNTKIGEAPCPDCGIHANVYEPSEVQTASPTATQDKSLFSVIKNVPTPAEWALNESPEANHQLKCNKSVFKENQNSTPSATKDESLAKDCKARESLLKKTLKKEHQVNRSTYKINSGSKTENSCEQADDNQTDTTVLEESSDLVSLSQDALIAEILAESNLYVPMDKLDGKSESKQRKGKIAGISASSKVKKTRKESSDVCVSVEGIMKKNLANESSHRQCNDSNKMRHPKVHKKKCIDNLVSKGAMVENVGGVSGKEQIKARKRTHVKNPSINEQLAFVERILRERN